MARAAQPAPEAARAIELYGARLGMPAGQVRALAPGAAAGQRCKPEGDATLFLLECGPYRMTALFTGSGRAWGLRAAVDLTAAPVSRGRLRAMLQRRYGRASVADGGASPILVWLPRRDDGIAARCFAESSLLQASIEGAGARAGPVPTPGCYPIRFAILAAQGQFSGLIVNVMDPRPRLAELAGD